MKPGLYTDLTDTEYHGGPGISSSQLRLATRPGGLRKLKHQMDFGSEDKPAFALGRACHTAVLGREFEKLPPQLGAPLLPLPPEVGKTLTGKKAVDYVAAHPEFQVVAESDYELAMGMVDALENDPTNAHALELLTQPGAPEQSVYWEDEETGLLCKCRPDFLPYADAGADELVFVDYKTTVSADPDKFRWSVRDFGYYQAAAWYAEGLRQIGYHHNPRMVLVAQEKTAPFMCLVVELDPYRVEEAHELNHETLRRIAESEFTGIWPGYGTVTI